MNSIGNSRASAPQAPQAGKPAVLAGGILKALACAIAASSLLATCAFAASSGSDYDVIDVGSDPSQDDGAVTITEDDDSINLHMGGDPSHGIYHNPSQQNEYVYPPGDWRGGCGGGGRLDGQDPRGGYSDDRKGGYGYGWPGGRGEPSRSSLDRGYDRDDSDGGHHGMTPRRHPAGNGSGRCREGDPRECY